MIDSRNPLSKWVENFTAGIIDLEDVEKACMRNIILNLVHYKPRHGGTDDKRYIHHDMAQNESNVYWFKKALKYCDVAESFDVQKKIKDYEDAIEWNKRDLQKKTKAKEESIF